MAKNPIDANAADYWTGDAFDTFWRHYPHKVAKQQARRTWSKFNPKNSAALGRILRVLFVRIKNDWIDRPVGLIPYPSTFLRAEGFSEADVREIECLAGEPAAPREPVPWSKRRAPLLAQALQVIADQKGIALDVFWAAKIAKRALATYTGPRVDNGDPTHESLEPELVRSAVIKLHCWAASA